MIAEEEDQWRSEAAPAMQAAWRCGPGGGCTRRHFVHPAGRSSGWVSHPSRATSPRPALQPWRQHGGGAGWRAAAAVQAARPAAQGLQVWAGPRGRWRGLAVDCMARMPPAAAAKPRATAAGARMPSRVVPSPCLKLCPRHSPLFLSQLVLHPLCAPAAAPGRGGEAAAAAAGNEEAVRCLAAAGGGLAPRACWVPPWQHWQLRIRKP